MAEVLVGYSLAVKPGESVLIRGPIAAEALMVELTRAVLRAGGNPTTWFQSENIAEMLLNEGSDDQLRYLAPSAPLMFEQSDAMIRLLAPDNTEAFAGIDPAKTVLQQKSLEPMMETMFRRTSEGNLRWSVAQYPTQAAAQDAGMSLRCYEDFVYGAGLLNEPDPVAAWRKFGERQQRLVEWISTKSDVHISGSGTDLTIGIAGRIWKQDDGHINFPGGEIFTGPIEDSAEGTIQFAYPALYNGQQVSGVRLRFEKGAVVEATATEHEEYLLEMLALDDGAKRLGELAFGTNRNIIEPTKNTLFDEKIGGTLHMALGRSYPETGGMNVSALHWDMVYNLRDGAEVWVDGQLFSKNGEFQPLFP